MVLLRGCFVVSLLSLAGLAWLVGATHWPATFGAPPPWARFAVVVLASGGIGFLTNWLAIKMLFRPRQRQAWNPLWPQGLLPREQPRFAAAMGRVVSKRLVSPAAISQALGDERLRRPLGEALRAEIEDLLAAPATRDALADAIAGALRGHGAEFLQQLRPQLRTAIEGALDKHLTAERLIGWLQAVLGAFGRDAAIRRTLARWVFHETAREGSVARLVEMLREQFARYRERNPIRGFLAEQFIIDWDDLRRGLANTLRSPEATDQLADAFLDMADSLGERLRDPEVAASLAAMRRAVVDRVLDWFEREGVALLATRVERFADEPAAWDGIRRALDGLLASVPTLLFDEGTGRLREPVAERLNDLQARLVEMFPVAEVVERQVLAMDPAAVEQMVDDIGRRELAWIQLLGFVLGAAAGVAVALGL